MPILAKSAANTSAAKWQSPLCSSSVDTEGIRSRAFSSCKKRGWFERAYATAGVVMGSLSLSFTAKQKYRPRGHLSEATWAKCRVPSAPGLDSETWEFTISTRPRPCDAYELL